MWSSGRRSFGSDASLRALHEVVHGLLQVLVDPFRHGLLLMQGGCEGVPHFALARLSAMAMSCRYAAISRCSKVKAVKVSLITSSLTMPCSAPWKAAAVRVARF